jgi:hypothetical protein
MRNITHCCFDINYNENRENFWYIYIKLNLNDKQLSIMQYFSYAAILLFCIQIQAFCIYNNLDEGGSFDIFDEIQHGNET